MSIIKPISIFLLLISITTACTINKRSIATSPSLLNLQMQDMEYIKDVQDSTVQAYLLGSFAVGGKRNKFGQIRTNVLNLTYFPMKRGMDNTLYKILKQVPDADFIVPVYQTVRIDKMFLGRREYTTLRVKAFRLKTVTKDNTAIQIDSIK